MNIKLEEKFFEAADDNEVSKEMIQAGIESGPNGLDVTEEKDEFEEKEKEEKPLLVKEDDEANALISDDN